jgi:Tol biopolymer transport system component
MLVRPTSEDPYPQREAADLAWNQVPLVTSQDIMPASPAFSPDGEWIAYVADDGGQRDLWRLPVGGGPAERLTDTPEAEAYPAYSADGSRIAYAVESGSEPGIYLIPSRGGIGTIIIDHGTRPAWSPTRNMIAYVWRGAVWVAPGPNYADPWAVTKHMGGELDPVWSPDGRALFIWSEVDLDVMRVPVGDGEPEPLNLVPMGQHAVSLAVSADGSALILAQGQYGGNKDLWHVPLDPATGDVIGESRRLTGGITDDRDVSISPDSSKIAYLARNVERHLWAIPIDEQTGMPTSGQRLLTRRAPLNYYPALSPDGENLVWTAHEVAGFVYRMNLIDRIERKLTTVWDREVREIGGTFTRDGEKVIFSSTESGTYHLAESRCPMCAHLALTQPQDPQSDYFPAVSPDGSTIAFYSNRAGSEDIWRAAASGGAPLRVTDMPGAEQFPTWSPDSRSILFRSLQGEDADIWAIDVDGSNLRAVVKREGDQTWAEWSPDGSRLYFVSDESGAYEVWMKNDAGAFVQVTNLTSPRSGLPNVDFFTKFAVSDDMLVVPIELASGGIWILERAQAEDSTISQRDR